MTKIISYIRRETRETEILVFEDELENGTAPSSKWRSLTIAIIIGVSTSVVGSVIYAYMTA
jgi:hypothetical protein